MTAPQWTPLTSSTPSPLDAFRRGTIAESPESRVVGLRMAAGLYRAFGDASTADLCSLEADAQEVHAKVEAAIRHDREGKRLADELLRKVES